MTCPNNTCPEPADVTVENTEISRPGCDLVVTAVDTENITLEIQVEEAGYFLVRVWLIDDPGSAIPSETVTLNPPSGFFPASIDKVTDEDGYVEVDIENASAARNWRACVVVIGEIEVSDQISIGT